MNNNKEKSESEYLSKIRFYSFAGFMVGALIGTIIGKLSNR